jgi:hypothetical protein
MTKQYKEYEAECCVLPLSDLMERVIYEKHKTLRRIAERVMAIRLNR